MKDKDETPDVIDLSDRRPTPKELPAFAPPPPDPEQVRLQDEFWEAMRPLNEGLLRVQGELLSLLIQFALPELRRLPLPTIREDVRELRGLTEETLREWEAKLGTYPARLREEAWMDEHAYPLAMDLGFYDGPEPQLHETGVKSGRVVYLLRDGRLVLVNALEVWKRRAGHTYDSLTTLIGAELIWPDRALIEFPFHEFVTRIRSLLWSEGARPEGPPSPQLEQRRARFLAVTKNLSEATSEYVDRIRRAAITPV